MLAGPGAFAIDCGALQSFALSGSPGNSLTLNPDSDLPYSATCTVTVTASQVTDADTNDPHDQMAADFSFSFTTADPPPPGANVIINEIDADTPGNDTAEFVELFDGGAGNTPLDGLVVVFFAGPDADTPRQHVTSRMRRSISTVSRPTRTATSRSATRQSPASTWSSTPASLACCRTAPTRSRSFAGNASDFPAGTPVTTSNLQDAIVYGTDDADDAVLLPLLNAGQEQVNENAAGSGTTQSSQRCENGSGGARNTSTYRQADPDSGWREQRCPPPPPPSNSAIVISQVYGGGGNAGATYRNDYVELFNRGTAPVDITGWSLQYASATGSGWDFNKQPLAGTIAPGEYYLDLARIRRSERCAAAGGERHRRLINMSAHQRQDRAGRQLRRRWPAPARSSASHLRDLVGYGSANCREGTATAPAAERATTNSTAILRKLGGATDTDQNGNDFVDRRAEPAPDRADRRARAVCR